MRGERRKQGRDLVLGGLVQGLEGVAAGLGEGEQGLPRVGVGRRAVQELSHLEFPQDPAEIAGVQAEITPEVRCRETLAVSQLVEHADLGEREFAFQEAVVEQSDLSRVESVEGANRRNVPAWNIGMLVHGRPLPGAYERAEG